MKNIEFEPTTQRDFDRKGLGDCGFTYPEYVEMEKAEFERRYAAAQLIYLNHVRRFGMAMGDREAIGRIRNELRDNEDFWDCCNEIVRMVEGEVNWISNIFRAEAKRISRSAEEKREALRQERAAARAAEIAAEKSALESMPTFGMF